MFLWSICYNECSLHQLQYSIYLTFLFINAVSILGYMVLNHRAITLYWIGKDIEQSSTVLIWSTVMLRQRVTQAIKTWIRVIGSSAESKTGHVLKTSQKQWLQQICVVYILKLVYLYYIIDFLVVLSVYSKYWKQWTVSQLHSVHLCIR
jgi:hypothetical protein